MTSFFFWNVMKRDLRAIVAEAVAERNVDIVLLAECGTDDVAMAAALTARTGRRFVALSAQSDKVRVFTSLPPEDWTKRQDDPLVARMAIWSVAVGRHPGILLAVVHLVSKVGFTVDDQTVLTTTVAKELRAVETTVGHQRSIVVGDLNMNPFDGGVLNALCLHAVMTKATARESHRTVQGSDYTFLYNPMWGLFGDRTAGPPGTYFHQQSRPSELFWHMMDQVLLRPAIMGALTHLEIVDHIGATSLVNSTFGTPLRSLYSDHLPLAFVLDLN